MLCIRFHVCIRKLLLCCMNQTSCRVVSGFLLSGLNLSSKPNMQNCSYEVLNIVVISIFSVLLTCYIVQIRTICMLWYSCAQQGQLDRKVWTAVQLVYHLQFTIVYIRKLLSQQKKLWNYIAYISKNLQSRLTYYGQRCSATHESQKM